MLLLGRRRLLFPVLSGCVLILLLVNPALGASDSLEDLNLSYKTAQPLEVNFREISIFTTVFISTRII
jgi:hypothetical protein